MQLTHEQQVDFKVSLIKEQRKLWVQGVSYNPFPLHVIWLQYSHYIPQIWQPKWAFFELSQLSSLVAGWWFPLELGCLSRLLLEADRPFTNGRCLGSDWYYTKPFSMVTMICALVVLNHCSNDCAIQYYSEPCHWTLASYSSTTSY